MAIKTSSAQQAPPVRMRRVTADKIASSTVNLNLPAQIDLAAVERVGFGDVVVVKTLTDNPTYNALELTNGRLARITPGDVVIGVLGARRALKGFVGDVPRRLEPGDRLHILNLGGVMGRCSGRHHQLGRPIQAELLGMAIQEDRTLNIAQGALPIRRRLSQGAPLVVVAGTCMNSGKTQAATELIKRFSRAGLRVAAAKVSGVAALRDLLDMQDHGATATKSFLDCGYPSTVGLKDLSPMVRTLVSELDLGRPDLIVVELGDGLLGLYEVESIFDDRRLMRRCAALVFCTGDFVGAWGGQQLLRKKGYEIDVFSGSATDSAMGRDYLERELGVPAANALHQGDVLFNNVREKVE